MLEFLGEAKAAEVLRDACTEPVSGSTVAVGDEIARRVKAII
jgi:hypothetical protein